MATQDKKENFLNKLSPKTRKYLYMGTAAIAVGAFAFGLSSDIQPKDKNNEIKNVLTDKKTDEMGIESLLAQIKISNDNFKTLSGRLDKLSKENQLTRDEYQKNLTAINKVTTLERSFNKATQTFETQIKALSDRITELGKNGVVVDNTASDSSADSESSERAKSDNNDRRQNSGSAGSSSNREQKPLSKREVERIDLSDPYKLYANAPTPMPETLDPATGALTTPMLQTTTISEDLSKKPKKEEPSEPEIYIPAGSMMRGVLLAGLDAPTGTNAKKDPFPVNVRIQKDAILPNGYSADVKECFLLMSGYGDLSSERALLRSETMSCIKEDGSIIEAKVAGYASGEDGKAGIRGRLVSKTGSIIAKTMIAGFASGISSAFDVSMTPTINTSSDGTVSYQKVYNKEALRGASAKGVAKAFDKLSDYYMKMADQMFPIIEINGGREINIIVTNGAVLTTVRDSEGKPVGPGMMTGVQEPMMGNPMGNPEDYSEE